MTEPIRQAWPSFQAIERELKKLRESLTFENGRNIWLLDKLAELRGELERVRAQAEADAAMLEWIDANTMLVRNGPTASSYDEHPAWQCTADGVAEVSTDSFRIAVSATMEKS